MSLTPEVIKKSIESLIKLQDIDGKIFKLRAEEKVLPPHLQEIKNKIDDHKKALRVADRQFKDLDRERRALELRALTLQEDLKRAEAKKRDLRNTKEEFGATKEYESLGRKLQDFNKALEEKQKATTEKQTFLSDKQKQIETLDQELKNGEAQRKDRLAQIKVELVELESQRQAFISQVDEEVFSIYERVQRIRSGNGIAFVENLMCKGCFVSIPPQLGHRLDRLDEIITCPSCSRILYPVSDSEVETEVRAS